MRAMVMFCAACGLLASFPAGGMAQAKEFKVQKGSRATFTSDAPLETINGVARKMTGSFKVDPADLSTARGEIRVPVSALETGIELRDEHLQSDSWLDAESHPNLTFELSRIEGASSLSPRREARLKLHGKLTMHGVTKNVTIPARATWDGSSNIQIRGRFKVRLEDYRISVPAIVRLKVANEISIAFNLRGRA